MGNSQSGTGGADTLRELVNRRDDPEVELNEQQINKMLGLVAAQLQRDRFSITIVAVGGAVNTVLLHSRETTGDVDFFYKTKTANDDVSAIVAAAGVVAKQSGVGDAWLNNHTAVFIKEETQIKALYDEAVRQDMEIFNQPGLRVLAAPWRYAITTKLDRLMKDGAKPYDLADAVRYLHEIVKGAKGDAIPRTSLGSWAIEFRCTPPDQRLIQRLQDAYLEQYHVPGLQ